MQLPVKSQCNLLKYLTLYSYPRKVFNDTKYILNVTDLFNRSDVFDHLFFSNVL